MTDREKLIEWVCEATQTDRCVSNCNNPHCNFVQNIADHLISNGVRLETKQATSDKASEENKRWIPVTERLPEKKCFCLTARKSAVYVEFWNGVIFSERNQYGQPTHWMPLPEAPKEVQL